MFVSYSVFLYIGIIFDIFNFSGNYEDLLTLFAIFLIIGVTAILHFFNIFPVRRSLVQEFHLFIFEIILPILYRDTDLNLCLVEGVFITFL